MTWNWQAPDWPCFTWEAARISKAEEQFLFASGVGIGTAKHLGEDGHKQLLVEVMSGEAVATSAIEGAVLDRSGVRSLLLHQFGLESPVKRSDVPAEKGMAEQDAFKAGMAEKSQEFADKGNDVYLAP